MLALVFSLTACVAEEQDSTPKGGGVLYDEDHRLEDLGTREDRPRQYEVPTWVQETQLQEPEIIVSLDGLTVHLFDKATGFSRVYPTGVGAIGDDGKSFSPTGFFATSPNGHGWWNIHQRFTPSYFGGFPFLRITAYNHNGSNTYGFHGPITYSCPGGAEDCLLSDRSWFLERDFVSGGCMRMLPADIVELFFLVHKHFSVPVTIQQEAELDIFGQPVLADDSGGSAGPAVEDLGTVYGELGERPESWSPCDMPAGWGLHRYGCND